jgi:hypothetical protein
MYFPDDDHSDIDGLHSCPVCNKLFIQEKALYLHIMRVHPDGQRLALDLRADMYMRWQERLPRMDH